MKPINTEISCYNCISIFIACTLCVISSNSPLRASSGFFFYNDKSIFITL